MAAISEPGRIEIRAGELVAELVPEIGGSLAAFRMLREAGPVDLMRPLDPGLEPRRNPVDTAIFPMLPYANRIAGNRFVFEGREYRFEANNPPERFNVHGTAWQAPWRIEALQEDRARLSLRIEDPERYSYEAEQDFALDPAGLTVAMRVANRGARAMPFGFGLHPWFPREGGEEIAFAATDFFLEAPDGVASDRITLPPELDFSGGAPLPESWRNNGYGGWDGRAELRFPRRGLGLRIEADPVFRHLMLYADPEKPFFCLEPQTNASGALNRPDSADGGLIVLSPAETAEGTIRFEPFVLPGA